MDLPLASPEFCSFLSAAYCPAFPSSSVIDHLTSFGFGLDSTELATQWKALLGVKF